MAEKTFFIQNLRKLCDHFSQNKIAKETGFSPAGVGNYLKGVNEPSVSFLTQIKRVYGYNIDDFLFSEISMVEKDLSYLEKLDRYIGNYIVYYYDSTAYQGRVSNYAKNTLNYGVLSVFYDSKSATRIRSKAIFVSNRKEAETLLQTLNSLPKESVNEFYREQQNVYRGKIEQSATQFFISLRNIDSSDQCFMILNNPPSTKNYIGGLGTVNSVSRGREQMPCIQYILMTRFPLDLPDGQIYDLLSLGDLNIEVSVETEQLIELFKNLYQSNSEFANNLKDYQKKRIVEDSLSNIVSELIEANLFRFAKVSNMDDDKLYRVLKESATENDE